MDMQEIRQEVARLRASMNSVNDETGTLRTAAADDHMYAAFGALARLEHVIKCTLENQPVVAA